MASTDTGLQADPEPQTDTEEVQTPGTDAHIMSVINRPEFRNIVRWTGKLPISSRFLRPRVGNDLPESLRML